MSQQHDSRGDSRGSHDEHNKTTNNLLPEQVSPQGQNSVRPADDSKDQIKPNDNSFLSGPLDVKKAIKHGKARRVGQIGRDTEMDYCEDCGLPANNELLPLCGSRLDLAELGPGFPLYFEYVLFCGVLLFIMFAMTGIYGIIANKGGTLCEITICKASSFIEYSLVNRFDGDYRALNGINIAFVIVGLLVCYYYRRIQGMTADEANRGTITASDYAIIVKKIPVTETAESIKKFFEEKGRPHKKTTVKKVVLSYDIGGYIELLRKKNKLNTKKSKGDASVQAELNDIETQLKAFENDIANNTSKKFTGIAFVVFDTEKETNEVLEKWKMTELEYWLQTTFSKFLGCLGFSTDKTFNGAVIEVDKAPEPLDVFWENLGYTWWDIFKKRMITELASLLLIGCTFGAILGINYAQIDLSKDQDPGSLTITILSVIGSLIVNVINSMLGIFVRKLSGYEKHKTYTYFFISVAEKLSYAQFVNTAIITLLVQIVTKESGATLWVSIAETMVSKVFFLFVLNAIIPSMSYYFDPFYLMRSWKKSRLTSNAANSKLNQIEANLLFEGPPVDMAQRYANVQKTMLFTGFYASLVPVGILLSFFALVITYWTDKYLLLRRHSRPNELGKRLADNMSDFLELFFVSFTAGNLIFEYIIKNEVSVLNWIAFGISVLLYILPQKYLAICIQNKDETVFNLKPYNEARFGFVTEYDRVNPITQEEAMRAWFEDLTKLNEKDPNNPNNTISTETPQYSQQEGGNKQILKFLQQVPPQNTLNVLNNYANTNLSLNQYNNMNSNTNFMRHLPAQTRPQIQGNFINNQLAQNQFMNNALNMMNRGGQNFGPQQQPFRFINQQMANYGHMPMGQQVMFRPQQQQQPQQYRNQAFVGQVPQNNNRPVQQHLPQNNSQMNQSRPNMINSHLPQPSQIQSNPIVINAGQQQMPQPIQINMNMGQPQPQMGYSQQNQQQFRPQPTNIYQSNPQQQPTYQSQLPQQNAFQQQPQYPSNHQIQNQQNRPNNGNANGFGTNPFESIEKQFDKFMKLM